jgi:hypothetical protein
MFGGKCTQQLRNIPPSNNTVSRRIADFSEDLKEQLIEKVGLGVDSASNRNKYQESSWV